MSEIGVDRATMDAGSAAALYAGSIVLRKTFEAVAQRSVSSIFSSLHARFRGQHQLQALQRELESRLQVESESQGFFQFDQSIFL